MKTASFVKKVRKVTDVLVVTIPADTVRYLGIKEGNYIKVEVTTDDDESKGPTTHNH